MAAPVSTSVALLFIATAAHHSLAGPTGTIEISENTTNISPSREFSVILDDDGTTPGVFSFNLNVLAGVGAEFVESFSDLRFDDAVFGENGAITGPTELGALGGAPDILGPTFDEPLNGVRVITFTVTLQEGFLWLNTPIENTVSFGFDIEQGFADSPIITYAVDGGIVLLPETYSNVSISGQTQSYILVPTPASLTLLALTSLACGRRRR